MCVCVPVCVYMCEEKKVREEIVIAARVIYKNILCKFSAVSDLRRVQSASMVFLGMNVS